MISTFLLVGLIATPTLCFSPGPVDNYGFPNPSAEQLRAISDHADGTLSNAPPPPKLNPSSFPVYQLLAFNEHFEVAFFSSLIQNITLELPGYQVSSPAKKSEILEILDTVLAQEQLHAINAQNTLKKWDAFVPSPCQYRFPTSDLKSAIRFAERFTTLVLGTLQDAAHTLALNGDAGPVRGVASSLGQEGQQSGFYRILLSKKPSEKPFLTTNVAPFAFSWLQQWVVPGSCPFSLGQIHLTTFPALEVVGGGQEVAPKNQRLSFKADLSLVNGVGEWEGKQEPKLWITYFSGQLVPISVPVGGAYWDGRKVTLEAEFPFEENLMVGLNVVALTTRGDFKSAPEVPGSTVAAPALVQVDDLVVSWDGN
ncbi:hypothetical protein QBC38DRAFT_486934 [Podospora fimiseda]|uniref:Late sexual development protein n=1 Tax=Podospora fimiseda TaxID=252190 RepID=A0AAN7BI52_9PEZI|nr:hypothetical protein QBC38DRAFT_486934 [Podospora fimiseda]